MPNPRALAKSHNDEANDAYKNYAAGPRMRALKSRSYFRSRVNSDFRDRGDSCQPRIRWDFAIPDAEQLGIQEKTLRKHFRRELNGGKFKVDMLAGKTVTELMKDKDARVRLDAAKYYTARRMGWKETSVNEQVGKDGGPIETKDVSALDIIRARIASASARLEEGENPSEWSQLEAALRGA
jgi:hypothetical protein